MLATPAYATISEKDVLVIGRVIALLKDAPKGLVPITIADAGDATHNDVAAIGTIIGSGKTIGDITLVATSVKFDQIDKASAHIIYIPSGMKDAQLAHIFSVAELYKYVTISTDQRCLKMRNCAIFITSEPAVDIRLSMAASADTGVAFGSTFRMIVKEVE